MTFSKKLALLNLVLTMLITSHSTTLFILNIMMPSLLQVKRTWNYLKSSPESGTLLIGHELLIDFIRYLRCYIVLTCSSDIYCERFVRLCITYRVNIKRLKQDQIIFLKWHIPYQPRLKATDFSCEDELGVGG